MLAPGYSVAAPGVGNFAKQTNNYTPRMSCGCSSSVFLKNIVTCGFKIEKFESRATFLPQNGEIRPGVRHVPGVLRVCGPLWSLAYPRRAKCVAMSDLAPLIAVVGADGSGKTTVSSAVIGFVRCYGEAETAHLGLRSGDLGRAIRHMPLVGAWLDRKIHSRAAQARNMAGRIPGPLTALVIFGFSQLRLLRFKRMMRLRRAGKIIVTDRYPQIDVPGFYDGPGLSAARASGWFTRWLALHEFRQYQWMASFRPSLVIRLNVDLETAFARKPDHRYESLRQKVEATPRMHFGGAPIFDFDSNTPLDVLLADVRAVIADRLETFGFVSAAGAAVQRNGQPWFRDHGPSNLAGHGNLPVGAAKKTA